MLKPIYNQTVTILNKLKRKDTPDQKLDLWYKTVVSDVAWYTKSARSAGGSSVFIGSYVTVLIPFHDDFVPYMEWREMSDKDNFYTVSSGDYIILGEVTEDVDASNIVAIMEKYGENSCQVKHHNANYKRYGATVQLKIEGV